MQAPTRVTRKSVLAAFALLTISAVIWQTIVLREAVTRPLDTKVVPDIDTTVQELPRVPRVILFPRDYASNERGEMSDYYKFISGRSLPRDRGSYFIGKHFPDKIVSDQKSSSRPNTHEKSLPLIESIFDESYQTHTFDVFARDGNEETDAQQCVRTKHEFRGKASPHKDLDVSIKDIVEKFYHSQFYKEHTKVFAKHPLEEQLKRHDFHKYWFRFSGSSVYLEQYGVHYMVSRLVYSSQQIRSAPEISLLLGEVYDRYWQLVPDVELVVPTNDPDRASTGDEFDDGDSYMVFDASAIVPVPIFHKFETKSGMLYGPEDPRITLVKNSRGHEEPLVVFNENHRKLKKIDETDLDHPKIELKQFRSMFQCFPWQSQRGKANVDGLPEQNRIETEQESRESEPDRLYARTVELRIADHERLTTQKNWTPFVSDMERQDFGYDKYIHFVYRWADFEVLKCSLHGKNAGNCVFVYRADDTTLISDGPGPLRGGTALVNLNEILRTSAGTNVHLSSLYRNLHSTQREIWLGFARAHLNNCGCGSGSFYRPNLVIVSRNSDGRFSLSHVGLYTSLGIKVLGWKADSPDELCSDDSSVSVLIPNLIAHWSVRHAREELLGFEDYMAVTLSMADTNNYVLHLKGLLVDILEMDKDQNEVSRIFGGTELEPIQGHGNTNIECALTSSKEFCAAFGDSYWQWLEEKKGKAKEGRS